MKQFEKAQEQESKMKSLNLMKNKVLHTENSNLLAINLEKDS
jgi:hypothetical protein